MSNLRSFKFFKLLEKRSGRNKPQSMVTFKSSAEEEETEEELEREAKRVWCYGSQEKKVFQERESCRRGLSRLQLES